MRAFRGHTDTYVIFGISPEAVREHARAIGERLIHPVDEPKAVELDGAPAEVLAEQKRGAFHINPLEASRELLRQFPL